MNRSEAHIKHGHNTRKHMSRTYRSWAQLRNRCHNPNNPSWDRYGGAGIKVSERWNSFPVFLTDMGERPPGTSIDRWPDKNGNYEPSNCRWATPEQQNENRRVTVWINLDGNNVSAAHAARLLGVGVATFYSWIRRHGISAAVQKATQLHAST